MEYGQENLPPNVILIGAGASYGSQKLLPVPALGAHLFDALTDYDPHNWGSLPPATAQVFRDDFEQGWSRVRNEKRGVPSSILLRAMALYFGQFELSTDSLYLELGRKMKRARWQGAFVSLNYDRLLVEALFGTRNSVEISRPQWPESIQVCLPHGACFLFVGGVSGRNGILGFSGNASLNFTGNARLFVGVGGAHFMNPDGYVDGDPEIAFNRGDNSRRLLEDTVPPMMSYYEPGKRANAGESTLTFLRKQAGWLLEGARHLAIVGVRVRKHDAHLWEPVARSKARVLYCGGKTGGQEYREWARTARPGSSDIVVDGYFDAHFNEVCKHVGV